MKPEPLVTGPELAVVRLDGASPAPSARFGARAATLARLGALGLPVPDAAALSFACVGTVADGGAMPDLPPSLHQAGVLLAVRSSPEERAWGGPPALLCLGAGVHARAALAARLSAHRALEAERRLVTDFATRVMGLDPEPFEAAANRAAREDGGAVAVGELEALVETLKHIYAEESGHAFPECRRAQVAAAVAAMAHEWSSPSARILRRARGAADDAGLGLVVQAMPAVAEAAGNGRVQAVDPDTGAPALLGWLIPDAGAPEARALREERRLDRAVAADLPEAARSALEEAAAKGAAACGDAVALDFTLAGDRIAILDALPARRSARAAIRIAVDLAEAGAIGRDVALLRVDPLSLIEQLHPAVDQSAGKDVLATGIAASPGAACGALVFSASAAQAAASQEAACILVRAETGAEDIRGMHAARGVITLRGGMSSHAAVIARGLGLPCVVGAGELALDLDAGTLAAPGGRVLREGDTVSLDGTSGEVLAGAVRLVPPELDPTSLKLLAWADAARQLGVRGNADTPAEARLARGFGAEGIGLCRTEHMFFQPERAAMVAAMILAEGAAERREALARLLPMQRADFEHLFTIMAGLPVTIRLLDPPLHEFLPTGESGMSTLAAALALPPDEVRRRCAAVAEVNPMLGMRGVRLGITHPEIYEMQARAIFEAAVAVAGACGAHIEPEIMIPVVSACREVDLVKGRIEAVAAAVAEECDAAVTYRIGVMVETPRAALRAGDMAASMDFLSFGTNDLTQMTYGLSRDDAGRFMRAYVGHGIFPEDPFHTLDLEGVGELMRIAVERSRARDPTMVIGLCGEHGGDPRSVRFCKQIGFDYVSCSPYRIPIARLAAAQATLLAEAQQPVAKAGW